MSNTQELFDRQAEWQKSRKALSWPEKIRLAERVRESILRLRGARPAARPEPGSAQFPPDPSSLDSRP